jgi:tetratricopeptide (TPR) repeat protein
MPWGGSLSLKTKRKKRPIKKAKASPKEGTSTFKTSHFDRWKEAVSSHPKLFALILLSLVGTLLYINTIHNEFVFDDIQLIPKNKWIRSLTNLPDILGITSGILHYRPIREISYMIDYQFTGLDPVGYHLFNIFYHILTSYLVFLIASHISKDKKVAWITAILFIAHPIQTESVTYMSGRRDILSALFFLMGFYFFLKQRESPSKKYLFLIFLSYILSLFSKEMGVTLPALLLLYDLLKKSSYENTEGKTFSNSFQGFLSKIRGILKRYWAFYLALFLVALLFTVYKVVLKNPSHQEGFYGGTVSSNFLTVFRIWVFYIKILILPISLNAAHSFPISRSIFEFRTFLSVCILLAIFTFLIKLMRRKEIYSFSGFWFFVTLLPVSHIFPHHELLAEHYLYLPSFGFSMALGSLFVDFLRKERLKPFLYSFLTGLLLFYSYQTIHRNLDWKNGFTLWADAGKKSPDSSRATLNLGISYMFRGEYDKAIEKLRTSIQIKSDNPKAYNNLGVICLEKMDFDQAITEFKKAISYDPHYADAHNNLAKTFALKEWIDEAIEEERKAITFNPTVAEYHFNLAKLYEIKGLLNEAIREYKEAARLDPGFFEAHYYLGMVYSRLEMNREAILEFEKTIKLNPDSGRTYFMLGVNLIKVGEREKAIRNLEKALHLVPSEKEKEGIKSLLNRLQFIRK